MRWGEPRSLDSGVQTLSRSVNSPLVPGKIRALPGRRIEQYEVVLRTDVMDITNLTAPRIGRHIREYLCVQAREGAVVPTFRRSLDILFDKDPDQGYVTIQEEGVALHPWAVLVAEESGGS